MSDTWAGKTGELGGVPKTQILRPSAPSPLAGLGRQIVDVVCKGCGSRLGQVTEEPDGPFLTIWRPTNAVRQSNQGEPLWSLEFGALPTELERVTVHCFKHGHGVLTGHRLENAVTTYRRKGRKQRLAVDVS